MRSLSMVLLLLLCRVSYAGSVSYTYDDIGRLRVSSGPTGTVTYTLDAAGNRTTVSGATEISSASTDAAIAAAASESDHQVKANKSVSLELAAPAPR